MRKSFIIYTDMARSVCMLRDAEAGRVLKGLFAYMATGALPENLRGGAGICFDLMRRTIDRDWEKYDAVCRQRAEAGRAGGRKTQQQNREALQANQANASSALANQAENENESDNENENENESESENKARSRGPGNAPSPILYGAYRNLSFTPEEYEALKQEFPMDYEKRLERLSEYVASSGKKYASPLATIRAWARKEEAEHGRDNGGFEDPAEAYGQVL